MLHKFPYKWTLQDVNFTKDKGKVFSCFACGGGSTMGYKLAGFDVVGFNEIDKQMAECYIKNHNPKYAFVEPIQTFKLRTDLPHELFELDILDGSPPCSSFSMSGNRQKDWGKAKKFKEGQAMQVLDTLFFDFIDLAGRLKPKIVIAENVTGILLGPAKEYVDKIYKEFKNIGYKLQHFTLDASKMGVPQKRKRVFFIALRDDLCDQFQTDIFTWIPVLNMKFDEPEIPFKKIADNDDIEMNMSKCVYDFYLKMGSQTGSLSKVHPKGSYFNEIIQDFEKPLTTITSAGNMYHPKIPRRLNHNEFTLGGSFPLDYDFLNSKPYYIIGMSVPPVMMAQIAYQIFNQWLSKIS